MFGFPISGELWEDGRLVQYFERNRFEFHPENAPPYDVLIGRFGAERLADFGPQSVDHAARLCPERLPVFQ